MTTTITESLGTAPAPSKGGRMLIQLITPGDGSSGVYTPDVLEAAGHAQVFPAGTLMFADHPGSQESHDRPERSIRDVAGVLTEAARWDGTALVAEARTYEPWSSVLAQMHDAIGVSIRASARVDESDDRGRPIIAELVEGISVDFVTYPGRGGAIREVYESKRPAVQVVETLPGGLTASDLERRLEDALGGGRYVQDYTDEWVVWNDYQDGENSTWQQTYTADADGRITLTGTPLRVSRRVTYDAYDSPSSPAGVAMESHQKEEEPPMAHIQIDEAEHKRLTEAAAKVTALEAERDTAITERDKARDEATESRRAAEAATVSRIVGEAGVAFTKWERAGIESALPRTEDGALDEAAFTERVTEAATEKAAESGAGRPSGMGTVSESTTDWDAYDKALSEISKGA